MTRVIKRVVRMVRFSNRDRAKLEQQNERTQRTAETGRNPTRNPTIGVLKTLDRHARQCCFRDGTKPSGRKVLGEVDLELSGLCAVSSVARSNSFIQLLVRPGPAHSFVSTLSTHE